MSENNFADNISVENISTDSILADKYSDQIIL